MTGYGKSEAKLEEGTLTIELRSLNGKGSEINIKSPVLPKDKELEVRSRISGALVRGTIDLYLTWAPKSGDGGHSLNLDLLRSYIAQANQLARELKLPQSSNTILEAVLKMPDIVDSKKADVVTEDNWPTVSAAIDECIAKLQKYRSDEGAILYRDITSRVSKILALYDEVEKLEPTRVEAIKARITKAAEDANVKLDKERFEQEMIFYLEKLDINEERVRLRQHCKYFRETIDSEAYPGKKLGFIIQEMGREINTTGSKAGQADMQKLVVQMKDELEKIREQSMNVL